MLDLKSLSVWIEGLINAGISGGTVILSTMIIDPKTFNFNDGFGNLLKAAGISAIVSIVKYMSRNPIKLFLRSEVEIKKESPAGDIVTFTLKGPENIEQSGDTERRVPTTKETLRDISSVAVDSINKVEPENLPK